MNSSVTVTQTDAVANRLTTACLMWLPALCMMLVATLSYIDRNTLALLAPTILSELHLSNTQYGLMISAFSISYMLTNPLWGRIMDRVGVRRSMAGAVLLWTLASVAHAFAAGFRGFLVARTALGLAEASTFPGAICAVTQTLPLENRMRGIGLAYNGGPLGAILTPIILTPVAAAWGWRAAFWFTGALGVLWIGLWMLVSQRRDLARPCFRAEPSISPRWNDAHLWAFIGSYALGASPTAFVFYVAPIYLSAALHRSQIEIGHVLWIPPVGAVIGGFFWGWITDRFANGGASLPALRRQFLLSMLLSVPLAVVPHIRSYPITLAMLALAMFAVAGFLSSALAYGIRQYSTAHSGLIAGIGSGTWSAVVALFMPVVGRLFDLHRYDAAFALATLLPVAGYVIWLRLHGATQPGEDKRSGGVAIGDAASPGVASEL
ncbi:MAG: MFS transporter [Acidobacteriaceae bacterium]|nr:MFS transporter [Acidobacteriaceae bacterium]